uniref:Protease/reverse transcriptase n=1 Tax=Volvox carteri TaxID=3067 RepID=O22452_VOLCA|nr:protease/reverse transcriptase [Volvox carteri f. nagariensis]
MTNPSPPGRNAQDALEEDAQALGYLRLSCELPVKQLLRNCQTTLAAMQLLQLQFRPASQARLSLLEPQKQLRMGDDETTADFIQRAEQLHSDIISAGGQWDEAAMRHAILHGLPPQYAITVEFAMYLPNLTTPQLVFMLREKENNLKAQAVKSGLVGAVGPGRTARGVRGAAGASGAAGANDTCRYCGQPGHYVRECPVKLADVSVGLYRSNAFEQPRSTGASSSGSGNRQRDGGGGGTSPGNNSGGDRTRERGRFRRGNGRRSGSNTAGGSSGGGGGGVSSCQNRATVLVVGGSGNSSAVVLDSGSPYHLTCDRSLLHNYVPAGAPKQIKWGNNQLADVMGTGQLLLRTRDGESIWLRNVLHVPSSGLTLMSVDLLVTLGCSVTFGTDKAGTYLGPERGTAAHRVLVDGKVTVSSDVTFDDDLRGLASQRAGTSFGAGPARPGSGDPVGGSTQPATPPPPVVASPPVNPAPPPRPNTRSQRQPLHPPLATVCPANNSSGGGGDLGSPPLLNKASGSTNYAEAGDGNAGGGGNSAVQEPRSYEEAVASSQADKWRTSMDDEILSQLSNKTWELGTPPPGARILDCRWVYKIKQEPGGEVRYKSRLVVKGFEQRAGIDYGELFAPTTRAALLRALLAVAAARGMTVHQMDVKTAFLNGDLAEELWMRQPPGYSNGDPSQACRLLKSVYGLKQAPRCWYEKLAAELGKLGYEPSASDPALFVKRGSDGSIDVLVHVDDMLVAADNPQLVAAAKAGIAGCFAVRDLGEARYYLGMEIVQDRRNRSIMLTQQRYVEQLLQRHSLENAKPRATPLPQGTRVLPASDTQPILTDSSGYRALVGELNYLATSTRPDIAHAQTSHNTLSMLARHMSAPTKAHMGLALGVLRYVSGTRALGLRYCGDASNFCGYSDADWAGDPATRRSTTGYAFLLGSAAVSWSSQLQRTVAASSVEAEYQAAAAAVREALWLRKLASDLDLSPGAVNVQLDSQGALSLGNNPITSVRSKHIDVHHHIVCERVARGEVKLSYCTTEDMVADILTKALGEVKFVRCRTALGVT